MPGNLQIKKALLKICSQKIEQRINEIENRLNSIQESRNNETKSSAGDKYETGRAMMQLEEENHNIQLLQAREVRKKLLVIDLSQKKDTIDSGSLVTTSQGVYFISIGIGKIEFEGLPYFCLSNDSPIGQLMLWKKAGDVIVFNGNQITIKAIF